MIFKAIVVVVVVVVVAVLKLLGYNYIAGLSRDVSQVSYRDDPIFPILNGPSKGSAHKLKVVRSTLLKN